MNEEALKQVLMHYGNSRLKIARELGISKSAVFQWKTIPLNRVFFFEKATGISRHKLRPDIYGEQPASKRRQAA